MHRFPVGIPYAQRPVEAGARNANICTALERTSQPIGDMHRPIAVHALAENATQLTNNACKFTRVPGPQVEAWE